jgi:hypothetical protein
MSSGTRGRYRWRTAVRRRLPWALVNRGVADRGKKDCGDHEWFNVDYVVEQCYHCEVGQRPYSVDHFPDTTPRP